jgi:uncharacterized protein involved in outer membrane biogenesis
MVTLKRVELRLSPLPLLAQRVVIPRIDLTEPNAKIERLADGRANWVFDLPKAIRTPSRRAGWSTSAPSGSTRAWSATTTR